MEAWKRKAMNTPEAPKINPWMVILLAIGVLVLLTLVIGMILVLGLNRFLSSLWLYVILPTGIVNLVTGLVVLRPGKRAGNRGNRRVAVGNIVIGVVDSLVGLFGTLFLIFFHS